MLTEYDQGVKVKRGRGVLKHLQGRLMIQRLLGKNGISDLKDNVRTEGKKKNESKIKYR